ncbi:hypothetical protein IQ06DRAFT_376188 [Phaeosphaeriaceae sp. SRC1lsM3a]|nr:hypothetical protein IQ06DRAFT_376188 [Stagonospora sp. SRC1lsM3a]
MFALFGPAILLLGAVAAQVTNTPSVVTFISISPVPTTEAVFTIQTSVPGSATSSCYEVCIMEPCPPCGVTSAVSEGSMGIPPGETPIPSSLLSSRLSNITTGSITPSASRGTPASSSGTPPAQQSTAAASSLLLQGERTPLTLALAVSGLVLIGGTFVLL